MDYGKTKLVLVFLGAIIVTVVALFYIREKYNPLINAASSIKFYPSQPTTQLPTATASSTPNSKFPPKADQPPVDVIPNSLLLKVPFTPQAPTGNWDKIHNEDCEEASAIMANEYFSGNTSAKLDPAFVETQLTRLTDWELQTFGYNLDLSSEETVRMIESNFNLQAKIQTGYGEDDIKRELSQNHLVLIPENGQMLGNPNYKQPGPIYHMLVIRGYTPTELITNDPGTRNGLNYAYAFDTLYGANGNYDHAMGKVDLAKKNIIIVSK